MVFELGELAEPEGLKAPGMHASSPQAPKLRSPHHQPPCTSLLCWARQAPTSPLGILRTTHKSENSVRVCFHSPAILPKGFLDLEPEAGKGEDEAIVFGSKLTP